MISPCTASALGRRLLIRDRYPFSPRARTLRANLAKLRPATYRDERMRRRDTRTLLHGHILVPNHPVDNN